jgi:hypothetical protein
VIGKSKCPRALKGIDILDVFNISYQNQSKAWQDGSTMMGLLHRINRAAQARKKTFYILLDNCSSHIFAAKTFGPDDLPESEFRFDNLKIVFFPPNATSDCQPL